MLQQYLPFTVYDKKSDNLMGISHKHKKLYPRSPKVEFSSINLYNTMLIVSYVCLVYNEHKIVR